jgi:acyl-CoA thioesterase FadM
MYFLSILYAIIEAWFQSRADLFDKFTVKRRVGPFAIDFNMHKNNATYFHDMELARWNWTIRSGLHSVFQKQKWLPILGGISFRFRRSLHLFEPYETRVQVIAMDEKWLYVEHSMYTKGNLFVGKGVGRVCAVDGKTKKMIPARVVLEKAGYSPSKVDSLIEEYKLDKHPSAQTFVEHDAHLDVKAKQ